MPAETGILGIGTEMDVEIPMRDGVLLRGNLWRPDGDGPFPALLSRTPYGKSTGVPQRLVRAGYAVMVQDSRGRYASDGEFTLFTHETKDPEDGHDTVEWLAAQSWCNGRVGTFGASYNGWMQWMTAKTRPPHLVAMCARSIPLELTDVDWQGAFRPARRMHWWLTTIAPDLRRRAGWPPPHTPAEARRIWHELEHGRWLGLLPWSEVARFLPPPLDQYARDWLEHPGKRAWRFAEAHAEIEVPNLDFTGWYDHCLSIDHLAGMQRNGRTERARTQSKAVIGPWSHATVGKRECLGLDFGPDADVDIADMELRWFDHWLKDIDNGVDREPPVRYFVMGAGQWKSAPTWPPPGLEDTTFYLGSAGDAARPDGSGALSATPASAVPADTYRYDPFDPVPTLWTTALMAGASDRRQLEHRRDILVFRTPPLAADLEIAGRPEVILYAASSAPDTDFFAWLVDEDPEGAALEVACGMVRARHRNSREREDFLIPGEVTEFRIVLGHTACRFRAGHRLRLDISSSDFPNFDRNHNVGRNDLFDPELAVAEQTLYHSDTYRSRLLLPGVAA